METSRATQVSGILFLSFQQACSNLEFYLDDKTLAFLSELAPDGWYPLTLYTDLMATVSGRYADPGAVLERVGEAMMNGWYHFGPGKDIIASGVDFLRHQTGSAGYRSLIRGPAEVVGDFSLVHLDESRSRALVRSTTPFSKDLERGVLQGGLALVGDLRLILVDNAEDSGEFHISYLPSTEGDASVDDEIARFMNALPGPGPALSPAALTELGYRHRELWARDRKRSRYWRASNQTLSDALIRNQHQQEELARANTGLLAANRRADLLKNAIVDLATDGIVTFDDDGRIVEFNRSAERIFGLEAGRVLAGTSARRILPDRVFDRLEDDDGPAHPARSEVVHSSGRVVPVDCTVRRVELEGQFLVTAYISDRTDLAAAEREIERQREALVQSEKLTALGSLLSGVAHELNNPLSIVAGRAQLLEQECADPRIREPLEKIRKAAGRCTRIVRTFLAMARQQAPEHTTVDLNGLIEETLDLLDYPLRTSGVTVIRRLDPDLPTLHADTTHLGQVVTNLLINAQQALADHAGPRRIVITTGRRQDTVVARVEDSGPGIPDDIRHRIFEPFFTTKKGTGTGVGLSLSHGLIAAHGGALDLAESTEGGAGFVITLPQTPHPGQAADHEPEAGVPVKALRVLIVDDEPDVADMIEDILRVTGHETRVAHSGGIALDMLRGAHFDVILSDLNMPDVSGPAFYAALERDYPDYPGRIAFVTGDALGAAAQRFLARSGCPYVEKPFAPGDIRDLVVSVAGGR